VELGASVESGFTPDSKYVVSGSEGRKILFWNIETGKEIQLLEFHPKTINCVKFSWTYVLLVSACQNLVIWIPEKFN